MSRKPIVLCAILAAGALALLIAPADAGPLGGGMAGRSGRGGGGILPRSRGPVPSPSQPVPPPSDVSPPPFNSPAPPLQPTVENKARLTLIVPENAEVLIEGQKIPTAGTRARVRLAGAARRTNLHLYGARLLHERR